MVWVIAAFSDLSVSMVPKKWETKVKNIKKLYFPKTGAKAKIKAAVDVDKKSGNWTLHSYRLLMNGATFETYALARKAEKIAQNHSTMSSFDSSYLLKQKARKHPKVKFNSSSDSSENECRDFKNIRKLSKADANLAMSLDKKYNYEHNAYDELINKDKSSKNSSGESETEKHVYDEPDLENDDESAMNGSYESDSENDDESAKNGSGEADLEKDDESEKHVNDESDMENDDGSAKNGSDESDMENDDDSAKNGSDESDMENDDESEKNGNVKSDMENDDESAKDSSDESDLEKDDESAEDSSEKSDSEFDENARASNSENDESDGPSSKEEGNGNYCNEGAKIYENGEKFRRTDFPNTNQFPFESTNLEQDVNMDYDNFRDEIRLPYLQQVLKKVFDQLKQNEAQLKAAIDTANEAKKSVDEVKASINGLTRTIKDLTTEVFDSKEELKKRNGMFTDLLTPDIQLPIKSRNRYSDVSSALSEHKIVDNLIKYLGSTINEANETNYVKTCLNVLFTKKFFMDKIWWKKEKGKVNFKNSSILHCVRESFKMKFGLVEQWKSDKSIDDFVHKICKNVKDNTRKAEKAEECKRQQATRKPREVEPVGKEKTKKISKSATRLENAKQSTYRDESNRESTLIEIESNKASEYSEKLMDVVGEYQNGGYGGKTSKKRVKLMAESAGHRDDGVEDKENHEKTARKRAKLMAESAKHRDDRSEDNACRIIYGEGKNYQETDEKSSKKAAKKRAKLMAESVEHRDDRCEDKKDHEKTDGKKAKKRVKLMVDSAGHRDDRGEDEENHEKTDGKTAKKRAKLMAESTERRIIYGEEKNCEETDEKSSKKAAKKRAKSMAGSAEHPNDGGAKNVYRKETVEKVSKKRKTFIT